MAANDNNLASAVQELKPFLDKMSMVVQNHPNAEPDEIAKMIAGRDVNQIGLDAFNGFTQRMNAVMRQFAAFDKTLEHRQDQVAGLDNILSLHRDPETHTVNFSGPSVQDNPLLQANGANFDGVIPDLLPDNMNQLVVSIDPKNRNTLRMTFGFDMKQKQEQKLSLRATYTPASPSPAPDAPRPRLEFEKPRPF